MNEWIEIPVDDAGAMVTYVAHPDGVPTSGVIICHELFGVTADIRGVADRLAASGVLALAPNFYHRDVEAADLPRDAEGRDRGFAYLHRMTRAGALADVRAAAAHLGDLRVGLLGLSAGGHLAFYAATQLQVSIVAIAYGGWLTSTDIPLSRPEPTLELAPGISGRVLNLVGDRDTLIPVETARAIERGLTDAGVPHEVVVYPGVAHAFLWPGTPAYDADAADDAWRRIITALGPARVSHPTEPGEIRPAIA
ncbi:MAG TPA: dienelactone hydrolase family protein [Micromonosporaceae bacterium]|jgi:carboxymethylenebutenolidase